MNDIVPRRQAPALALAETLLKLVADPQVSAEKLQILLQVQKDIMADSRREAFQAAFAAMAPELPRVNKRGFVELIKADGKKVGQYRYMKYEDMDELIRPILHKFGFSLSFQTTTFERQQVVHGKLMHDGGHFEHAEMILPPDVGPGRNALQAVGSSLSYAKRYLADLLLNIVREGEDDDAVGALLAKVTPEQVATLTNLLNDTKTKPDKFLEMMVSEAKTLDDIPQREFARLKNVLEAKVRSLAKDRPGGKK